MEKLWYLNLKYILDEIPVHCKASHTLSPIMVSHCTRPGHWGGTIKDTRIQRIMFQALYPGPDIGSGQQFFLFLCLFLSLSLISALSIPESHSDRHQSLAGGRSGELRGGHQVLQACREVFSARRKAYVNSCDSFLWTVRCCVYAETQEIVHAEMFLFVCDVTCSSVLMLNRWCWTRFPPSQTY